MTRIDSLIEQGARIRGADRAALCFVIEQANEHADQARKFADVAYAMAQQMDDDQRGSLYWAVDALRQAARRLDEAKEVGRG